MQLQERLRRWLQQLLLLWCLCLERRSDCSGAGERPQVGCPWKRCAWECGKLACIVPRDQVMSAILGERSNKRALMPLQLLG